MRKLDYFRNKSKILPNMYDGSQILKPLLEYNHEQML